MIKYNIYNYKVCTSIRVKKIEFVSDYEPKSILIVAASLF